MKADLKSRLLNFFEISLKNEFGKENWDEHRFGEFKTVKEHPKGMVLSFKLFILKLFFPKKYYAKEYRKLDDILRKYGNKLEKFYSLLNEESRELFVQIVAYRILGYKRVKLPLNTKQYHDSFKESEKLIKSSETLDTNFFHFKLSYIQLKEIGYNINYFHRISNIVTNFIIEQYKLSQKDKIIQAEAKDVVLDLGGCWGDTALYFADKVGTEGKVYSFEFIPNNIAFHKKNTSLNPHYIDVIELVENPVYSSSNIPVYYKDEGPSSTVSLDAFEGQTGQTTTVSIDDFKIKKGISKVDFIKMDIEGAEMEALKGAKETLKNDKPKLAIAIYHSWDDFVDIPEYIDSLDLGYTFYLGHYTIHSEETILFAEAN